MAPPVKVGASYFRGGGATGVLKGADSTSGVYTPNTRSIYAPNTLDALSSPSVSDVCTAGTTCLRRSALLLPPVLAVLGS